MKTRNILINFLVAPALLGLASSCASDYLDTKPESSVSTADVTGSVDVARMALYGICASMQWGYDNGQASGWLNSGEAYMNNIFNDAMGQDYITCMATNRLLGPEGLAMKTLTNDTYIICAYPWNYAYSIIMQANNILAGIEGAEGSEDEKKFIEAQALTFRAFGYMKLMQWYAPRWEDSQNGERYCIVLRTEPGTDPTPLVTMNTALNQIYTDVKKALELYDDSSSEREYIWEPNRNIACGVLARTAMIKHDWATAQDMAHQAREGFKVMDNDAFFGGQNIENGDYMWAQSNDGDDTGYLNYGGWWSCNGPYVHAWDYGAGSIDLQLYNQLDENDVRRKCYITPDKLNTTEQTNPGKLTEADFWNSQLVGSAMVQMNIGPSQADRKNPNKKWGLTNFVMRYVDYYFNEVYTSTFVPDEDSEGVHYGYYSLVTNANGANFKLNSQYYVKVYRTPIGAQLKFVSAPPYGSMYAPFMRAAEMCITEAEAAYMAGDYNTAKNCLMEINSIRIPGYTCDKTGEALLNEIKLCRRIELWGEGHNWSDFKRWNTPINRVKWDPSNPGGNWVPSCGGEVQTTAGNGWRFAVPTSEWQYNHLIDRSLLNY